MEAMECATGQGLLQLYQTGKRMGWHGFVGGSVSQWMSTQELLQVQAQLRWDGAYRPLGVEVPRLSRECFFITRQEGVRFDTGEDMQDNSLLIIQIGEDGRKYRVLWESIPDDHPPLEVNLHMVIHNARSNGPGGVAYHCQPISLIALAALNQRREGDLTEELSKGFAAIRNVVPDGVDSIPWGMPRPIRRGMPMSASMLRDMRTFLENIAAHIANHEAVALEGEGLLVASNTAQTVYGIVNTIEHSAKVRLKILSAGGE